MNTRTWLNQHALLLSYFSLAARQSGLSALRIHGDLTMVKRLDVPAVLKLETPEGAMAYLAVRSAENNTMTLSNGAGTRITADDHDIAAR